MEKVLTKTFSKNMPIANTSADYVRILFNGKKKLHVANNSEATTTTTSSDLLRALEVSYCYPTKEWRCLYRCEIESGILEKDPAKIALTLFGSINNPTEEDWMDVELKLVANELEILNNKTTTAPAAGSSRDDRRADIASSSGGMQLYIKTLTGKTVTIDVSFC